MSIQHPSRYEDVARIKALAELAIGDKVRFNRRRGHFIGGNAEMVVEDISIDHTHGSVPHTEGCYTQEHIEYHTVINPKSDGTASLRSRFHRDWLIKVS